MSAPEFSVVVTLYNKAAEIRRTLRSVLKQTVQDFEVLVINDGSTDGSRAAAETVVDPRIRIIDQANAGESAARNRGIAEARAALIAFLDGDDEWMPSFLATITRLTHSFPEAGAFAAGYSAIKDPNIVHCAPKRRVPRHPWEGVLPDYFRTRNALSSSSIVVRKDIFSTAGLFRVGLPLGADLDMWFRIAARYSIAYSTHSGAVIHVKGSSPTSNLKKLKSESFLERSLAEIESAVDIPSAVKRRARNYAAASDLTRILLLLSQDSRFDASRALSRWRHYHGITTKWVLCKMATLLPESTFGMLITLRSSGLRAVLRAKSLC